MAGSPRVCPEIDVLPHGCSLWARQGKADGPILLAHGSAAPALPRHSACAPASQPAGSPRDPMAAWPAGMSPEASPRSSAHHSRSSTPEFARRAPSLSASAALLGTLRSQRASFSEPGSGTAPSSGEHLSERTRAAVATGEVAAHARRFGSASAGCAALLRSPQPHAPQPQSPRTRLCVSAAYPWLRRRLRQGRTSALSASQARALPAARATGQRVLSGGRRRGGPAQPASSCRARRTRPCSSSAARARPHTRMRQVQPGQRLPPRRAGTKARGGLPCGGGRRRAASTACEPSERRRQPRGRQATQHHTSPVPWLRLYGTAAAAAAGPSPAAVAERRAVAAAAPAKAARAEAAALRARSARMAVCLAAPGTTRRQQDVAPRDDTR
jgi:hypothetical protein